jgi:hypothetical protein
MLDDFFVWRSQMLHHGQAQWFMLVILAAQEVVQGKPGQKVRETPFQQISLLISGCLSPELCRKHK